MAIALALSERGRGRTGANPNVGCVIVKQGMVIGRGWTQPGGRPHAEEMALAQAGASAKGADIYVTMEPCAHESPRGPTCSNAIIDAKPKRVIVATLDADERTRRRGIDRLGDAGITVSVGIKEVEARRAMAGFLSRVEKARPYVTLKLALSLDGCIAMADGSSQWITGDRARAHAHLERARSDAILVGAGTAKADKPSLDVRIDGLADRSPQPVILGSDSELPEHWLQISEPAAIADLSDINWLLVEGGAKTAASFLKAGLVDRLLLYRAPIIIGGGLSGVGDIGLEKLGDAHGRWRRTDLRPLGQDVLEIYEHAA
ncbi:bifunctional diaminohydroxyphosphoribosylaminopyrimidine deaminase/5-amino-6-(5-phosphoribosylamino)uracil reductase RibD [Parasphingorhabdus sp.]|uniref:bifunctional diaminohydroxyphosphoribosylaminopyrimidine deaminase/5-amino-6-(5-phosphoribosylamino)uracil reductase RibD n=1 Tax=Parasphingorhabdus sp. TaxID=2709688 RepID=UPI003002EAB8